MFTWDEMGKPQLCITKLTVRENLSLLAFSLLITTPEFQLGSWRKPSQGAQTQGNASWWQQRMPTSLSTKWHLEQVYAWLGKALWQQIQPGTFQIPWSWARQHKGIATSRLHFKPNHWEVGRGMGREEEKSLSEDLIIAVEYKMSKWMW